MATTGDIWGFNSRGSSEKITEDPTQYFISTLQHLSKIMTVFGNESKSAFLNQMDAMSDIEIQTVLKDLPDAIAERIRHQIKSAESNLPRNIYIKRLKLLVSQVN